MGDNDRAMKGQNFRRLVPSLSDALNFFFVSFTQARSAILITRKLVWAYKIVYQIDFLVHEIDLNFEVTQHRQSVFLVFIWCSQRHIRKLKITFPSEVFEFHQIKEPRGT